MSIEAPPIQFSLILHAAFDVPSFFFIFLGFQVLVERHSNASSKDQVKVFKPD